MNKMISKRAQWTLPSGPPTGGLVPPSIPLSPTQILSGYTGEAAAAVAAETAPIAAAETATAAGATGMTPLLAGAVVAVLASNIAAGYIGSRPAAALYTYFFNSPKMPESDEEATAAAYQVTSEILEPIFSPFTGPDVITGIGGDLSEISSENKGKIIEVLTTEWLKGNVDGVTTRNITDLFVSTGIATEDDFKNDTEYKEKISAVSSALTERAHKIVEVKRVATGGRGISKRQQATAGSCVEETSSILKEKGFLDSIETSWTPTYDKAFREFIDAATLQMGELKTNMVGGDDWISVAPKLGQTPDVSGACSAIKGLNKSVASKATNVKSDAVTPQKPIAVSDGSDILAEILSAMYNEKLIGTPGLDFIREVKRIQSVVNAVGGASPVGFKNAAKVLLKRNPSINPRLPKSLSGAVDKSFAFANKALFQTIQTTINGLYSAGVEHNKALGIFNPNITQSSEAIKTYVSTPAGGNWKFAGNNPEWVKLATQQRKDRIRAGAAQEMTVLEKINARKIKAKEAIK